MHQRGLFLLTSGCLIVAALRSLSCPFRSPIDQRWIKRITFLCSKASKLQSGLICQKSCLISCGRPAEKRTLRAATSSAWTVREVVRDVAARCGLGEEIACPDSTTGGLSRFPWLTDPAPKHGAHAAPGIGLEVDASLGAPGRTLCRQSGPPSKACSFGAIHSYFNLACCCPGPAPSPPKNTLSFPFPSLARVATEKTLHSPARRECDCETTGGFSSSVLTKPRRLLAPFPRPDRVLTRPRPTVLHWHVSGHRRLDQKSREYLRG